MVIRRPGMESEEPGEPWDTHAREPITVKRGVHFNPLGFVILLTGMFVAIFNESVASWVLGFDSQTPFGTVQLFSWFTMAGGIIVAALGFALTFLLPRPKQTKR